MWTSYILRINSMSHHHRVNTLTWSRFQTWRSFWSSLVDALPDAIHTFLLKSDVNLWYVTEVGLIILLISITHSDGQRELVIRQSLVRKNRLSDNPWSERSGYQTILSIVTINRSWLLLLLQLISEYFNTICLAKHAYRIERSNCSKW